ncbi:phosphatase PAP2 family protein [Ilumatobacter sp.]|uniref:phosphatase PAP2 family protein n=1 Tax=Ilumatobacter sp. TaxID=1967498 RepID=UPI003AF73B96
MTTSSSIEHEPQRRQPFAVRDAMSTTRMVTSVAVSLVVLVASSAIAWNGEVPDWEADLLRWMNDWPDWLEPIMWTLQQVGVLAGPLIGGLVIARVARRWEYLIPFLLLMPLKLFIEKAVLKQLVERQRPFVSIGPDITVRGPAFEGLSFPSGHATTAVAFGILVAAFLPPRWRPLPVLWAAAVCVARIYFGEHNVLDVVAGAALGTLFATVLWFTILNRWVEPDEEPGQ